MPVTFGAVGDVIAVVLLIKDLVAALNDCRGSAYNFQLLVQQLQSLERALIEVDLLVKKHAASPGLSALCCAVGEAAGHCQNSAKSFYEKVKKYQQSLKPHGSGNFLKDTTRKIQFQILDRKDIDEFYGQVTAHVSSLNLLMITWSM